MIWKMKRKNLRNHEKSVDLRRFLPFALALSDGFSYVRDFFSSQPSRGFFS
jgi:hypothetical protein